MEKPLPSTPQKKEQKLGIYIAIGMMFGLFCGSCLYLLFWVVLEVPILYLTILNSIGILFGCIFGLIYYRLKLSKKK